MNEVAILLQVFVALVVFNVWTFRAEKPTKYRGGSAKTLREEFMEFGLSEKIYMITSLSKPMLSVALIVAIFFPFMTIPIASAMAFFMAGALLMHYRVRDEFIKFVAPGTIFACCVAIVVVS
jgi:hypothetical protein